MGDSESGLSFDLLKSRFLLIGTSQYKELPQLPTVSNNLDALERILRNSNIIGIPRENVVVLRDPPNKAAISDALIEAADKADDLLFIYFAGHGLLGKTNKLFLAATASTEANCDWNGFDFEEIRSRLATSPPKQRVLILDCCFSGNALDGMGSVNSIVDANIDIRNPDIDIKSSYAIASAPPNRTSMAPKGMEFTAFSSELINLLENGLDIPDRFLAMEKIYETLRERIRQKKNLPEPRKKILYDGDKLVLAQNCIRSPERLFEDLSRKLSSLQKQYDEMQITLAEKIASATDKNLSAEKQALRAIEARVEARLRDLPKYTVNSYPATELATNFRFVTWEGLSRWLLTISLCSIIDLLSFAGLRIVAISSSHPESTDPGSENILQRYLSFATTAHLLLVCMIFMPFVFRHLEPRLLSSSFNSLRNIFPKNLLYGPMLLNGWLVCAILGFLVMLPTRDIVSFFVSAPSASVASSPSLH